MTPPSAPPSDSRQARWLPRLDAFGSWAALVCAVHCAALPLAAVAMPLATVEVLGDHRIERVFVVFAGLFGALVLGSGLSRSRMRVVFALFGLAIGLLAAGAFSEQTTLAHALTMTLGGLGLGAAHGLNRYAVLSRRDGFSLWSRRLRRQPVGD
ncbi:MAG: MerC domain-containing protein [Lysobacterales bacterium]